MDGGGSREKRVKFDPVAGQLAFTVSTLHITTELLKQLIVDIRLTKRRG